MNDPTNSAANDRDVPDDLDEIIEIHDPEIDVKAIVAQIRANLAEHNANYKPVYFPSFGAQANRPDADEPALSPELYYDLGQLNVNYDQITVSSTLEAQPASPAGRLIGRVKLEFHNLAVYYVNLLASKQVSFNDHATRSLNEMVKELERQRAETEALRQEVTALRRRLAHLEGTDEA